MEPNLIIYTVKSKTCPVTDELFAFFDDRKKAKEFLNKFKQTPGLKIATYHSGSAVMNRSKLTAHCILLHHTVKHPCNIDFYQLMYSILLGLPLKDAIQLTLLAECKAAALKEAIAMRDAVARTTDWRFALLRTNTRLGRGLSPSLSPAFSKLSMKDK